MFDNILGRFIVFQNVFSFLVRQLFIRHFPVNYLTVNLLLFYEFPDYFVKQSAISAFLYFSDQNKQLTVK